MKRTLIISFILHLLIIIAIFIFKPAEKAKEERPIIAEIITPEKPQQPLPAQQKKKSKPDQQRLTRSPKIKDKEPPKVMSQTPSKKARKKQRGTVRDRESGKPEEMSRSDRTDTARKPIVIPPGYGVVKPKQQKSDRDQIFDSETIARSSQQPGGKKTDETITFDTKDFKYYGYMQRLREKIEYTWKYPAEAGARRISGEVYIRFTIRKDGRLMLTDIVKSSGYRFLDDAAVKALRDAAPYWPLPEEWKQQDLTITGRFIYSLQERRIR